jgi:KipI family sensor histidine kinase inhibitor
MESYNILPAGDMALVVDFGNRVDVEISTKVLALAKELDELGLQGVIETVPTIRSLSVYYEPLSISADDLHDRISSILNRLEGDTVTGTQYDIPVCYGGEFAPDLNHVAERCGLSPDQVIELHSGQTYHVYMLGFLPGLAYLGDLPEKLVLPRRETPRPRIPDGSVGIGGKLTCIYPMPTPCGWHLIGRSPISLWDPKLKNGALLKAGDKVRFVPVSCVEYERMRSRSSFTEALTHGVQTASSH